MDPDLIFVVVLALVFFGFVYLMIRSKHRHELEKLDRIAEGNADRSLTTGELEDMVRAIVTDMTEPLKARLDDLSRQAAGESGKSLLDLDEPVGDEREAGDKTVGRRTRS